MDITAEALIEAGYKECRDTAHGQGCQRFFQKRFRDDDGGTRYFIDCRFYEFQGHRSQEFNLVCEAPNDGYAWLKFKQPTIGAAEDMADRLWATCGSIWYEKGQGA